MAGNKRGGLLAKQKNYQRFGKDFYRQIGAIGGRNGHTGGFASMSPERLAEVGRKGGLAARRAMQYRRDGMRAYLEETRALHNDLGYDDWQASITLGTTVLEQTLMFNVGEGTITRWRRQTALEAADKHWKKRP